MKIILAIILLIPFNLFSQENLLELLEDMRDVKVTSTFKSVKIVNAQSVEIVDNGDLLFLVQHRFGTLNSGAYNFFGLDNSQVRIGLDYGLNDWSSIGIGRSSFLKTIDGNFKFRLLAQRQGYKKNLFTLVCYSAIFKTNSTRRK